MASHSTSSKKSRAKSCTACRQVKLRCDVREKYPQPCSRCITKKLECKMDSNFKRVNTRSRLLPASTDPYPHRVRALAESQLQLETAPLALRQTHFKPLYAPTNWLELEPPSGEQDTGPSWTLGLVNIEYQVMVDLYHQFDEYYYESLAHLRTSTVASEASQRQSGALLGYCIYDQSPSSTTLSFSLISALFTSPVQALKDLQALIIICQWPLDVGHQSEDPSWMHSGFVVNAALHMGLDKLEDEVLFGHRRAKHILALYNAKYRRRTWLKIFQISTQLSAWNGLRPPIASPVSLQKLSDFHEGEVDDDMGAMTEIQRQFARNTISLDELSIVGPQVSLLHSFVQELDAIRRRFTTAWSDAAEINLQGVKLFLFEHCLLLADDQEAGGLKQPDRDQFVATVLQQGHTAAINLIEVIKDLGLASTTDPPCVKTEDGGAPLLAHPKQHFRLAFFACLFLLQYLDYTPIASISDQDAARNGVSTVYQIFKQFAARKQVLRAANTIEVLGRSVVPGQSRIKTMVRTRMGASLNYNAIWTAAKLRGRLYDPELDVTASASAETSIPHAQAEVFEDLAGIATTNEPPDPSLPFPLPLESDFPWGIWDDAAYDDLGFGLDTAAFSGLSGNMDFL